MKYLMGLIMILSVFAVGCDSLPDVAISDIKLSEMTHGNYDQGQTVNEYLGKNITQYFETMVDYELNCTSGECPKMKMDSGTHIKDCYFCNASKMYENGEYAFFNGFTGGMDAFAGCVRKFDGPQYDGMQVIEKDENHVLVQGVAVSHYSLKSTICNKEKDPECDDTTYGRCSEPDYAYTLYRTMEFEFRKDMPVSDQ